MKTLYHAPIYGSYDVVVAGCGTAGFAAAVAAAQSGAKTLVLEQSAYPGGTSTGGMVSQFMGFAAGETEQGQRGVFGQLLRRLRAADGISGFETIYLTGDRNMDVTAVPYEPNTLKTAMDDMLVGAGAEVLLHTRVIGTLTEDGAVTSLLIHNLNGIQQVKGKVYIDASFHGSVAAEAGCRWEIGDENQVTQPGTLMFNFAGADIGRYESTTQAERRALAKQGLEEGRIFVNTLLARPLPNGAMYSNMGRIVVNPLDPAAHSRAEIAARAQIEKISSFFVEHVPGFEHAYLSAAGSFLGLRDSRRILGQYTLTRDDVISGTEFPDAIVSSSYPIDIHDADGVSSTLIKPESGMFHVPYRCLQTGVKNLLVTGRCISCDCQAHACIRVMVTCFRLGEAAGVGAALSIRSGVDANHLDGALVRDALSAEG